MNFKPHEISLPAITTLFAWLLTSCTNSFSPDEALGVTFTDRDLAACVRESGYDSKEDVRELSCSNMDIADLSGVEELENLESVDFSSNGIDDAGPLQELSKLTYINMDSTGIDHVEDFSELENLETLYIGYTLVSSVEPIKDLPRLKILSVSGTEPDFRTLNNMEQLHRLELADCDINSIESILSLTTIKELDISGNELPDVFPLTTLENLVKIVLKNTNVTRGLGDLTYLAGLEEVDLTGNENIPCAALEQLRQALGEEAVIGVTTCVENPTLRWCEEDIPIEDHIAILNHTLVLRSMYSDNTGLQALFFARFAAYIILNGLNFSEKSDWELTFTDKQYRYGSENDYLFITFVFTEDFGDFKAGDTIPYDLTTRDTYIPDYEVTAPEVDIMNPLDSKLPTLEITEKGPLFELADWDVEWDGLIPKFSVTFPNLGALGVTMGSRGEYYRMFRDTTGEGDEMVIDTTMDTLKVNYFMPVTSLRQFKNNIDTGSIEIKIDDTEYKSNYFKIHQTMYESGIDLVFRSDEWTFDGKYKSTFTRDKGVFYSESQFSNYRENYSDFYCDADLEAKLGTASHQPIWPFGTYTAVSGEKFYYLLVPF